jgi:hypothetical protein
MDAALGVARADGRHVGDVVERLWFAATHSQPGTSHLP